MEEPTPFTLDEAARISKEIAEHQAMYQKLHAEAEGLEHQHPHHWAGMNSDLHLTLADSLEELLEKLRPDGDKQRIVAVEYLDPDPPELILRLADTFTTPVPCSACA